MRLLTLELLAYGPFTERVLDLSGGKEGIHLVYGPNEAGKVWPCVLLRDSYSGFHNGQTTIFSITMPVSGSEPKFLARTARDFVPFVEKVQRIPS